MVLASAPLNTAIKPIYLSVTEASKPAVNILPVPNWNPTAHSSSAAASSGFHSLSARLLRDIFCQNDFPHFILFSLFVHTGEYVKYTPWCLMLTCEADSFSSQVYCSPGTKLVLVFLIITGLLLKHILISPKWTAKWCSLEYPDLELNIKRTL